MDIKDLYKEYLSSCVLARKSSADVEKLFIGYSAVTSYMLFLNTEKLFDYNPVKWQHITNIFDYTSSVKFKSEILDVLYNDTDFIERDKNDNQYYRTNAIKQYYSFLKTLELLNNKTLYQSENKGNKPSLNSLQDIYYGAPGTGKSHAIDGKVTEDNSIRTTFHPDSDYASFVGCYKPVKSKLSKQEILEYDKLVEIYKKYIKDLGNVTHASAILGYNYHDSIVKMTENGKHSIVQLIIDAYKPNTTYDTTVRSGMLIYEESQAQKRDAQITYDFVPQAFTRAYIEAWKDTSKPYYLVIEEINRGNCAQIFGDIFQLLDRGEDGFSSYKITPDTDLQQYLAEQFAKVDIADADIKEGLKMQLPNNLHILATMNTSDQSLFPIDSAFKRRWEWKYIPIKNEGKNHKIVVDGAKYDWFAFMKLVNDRIENVTDSEDKQIGYWFAKANEKDEISAETLVSKVIFYLWNDVFKDYAHSNDSLFHTDKRKYKFREFYHENGDVNTILLKQFLKELGLKDETPQTNEVPSAEENQEPEQPAEE